MSTITFITFWIDKRAARADRRRVSEQRLHLFELLGGWPGSLAAQHLLRHKSVKRSYRMKQWGVIALHVLAWGGAIWAWFRFAG